MDFSLISVYLGGIATVFTPCILPVLPVYLGVFSSAAGIKSRLNIVKQTLLFGLGFSLLFILLGLGAASISGFLTANREVISIIGAVIIIIMGFLFSGVLKIGFLMREYRLSESFLPHNDVRGITSFFAGILFAAGWSPCAGPILGSVLTFVAMKSTSLFSGAALMALYSVGILTPFVIISSFADILIPKIKKVYQFVPAIQKFGSVLLIAGGLYLLISSLSTLSSSASLSENKRHSYVDNTNFEGPPRMIFVLSHHCPECKKLHAVLPEIKSDCLKMNIEIVEKYVEDEPFLKSEHNINIVPTILLLDSYGKEVKRIFGRQDISMLRIAAASIMNSSCAGELPDIEKVKSNENTCGQGYSCKEEFN